MSDPANSRDSVVEPHSTHTRFFRKFLVRSVIGLFLVGAIFWVMKVSHSARVAERENRFANQVTSLGGQIEWRFADPEWFWESKQDVAFAGQASDRISSIDFADSDSEVISTLMPDLEKLSQLRYLVLGGMTDHGIERLKTAPKLQWLIFTSAANVTDNGLKHLKDFPALTELILVDSPVTDAGLAHLKGLKHLKQLGLFNTKVTDEGLSHLKGIPNLQVLQIASSQITDHGMVSLGGLTKLSFLTIHAPLTDVGLVHLTQLKGLKACHLDFSGFIRNDGYGQTVKATLATLAEFNHQTTQEGRTQFRDALPNSRISPDP